MTNPERLSLPPCEEYFHYAQTLQFEEKRYIEDFSSWLPSAIIDSHTHANTKNHVNEFDISRSTHPGSTFPWFDLEHHTRINSLFYPRQRVTMIIFPNPGRGIDYKRSCHYLVQNSQGNADFLPVLYVPPNDFDFMISELKTGFYQGLKMYPSNFGCPLQNIGDNFPPEFLNACEEANCPVIIHLPIGIVDSYKYVTTIVEQFPRLKVILAHMGLSYVWVSGLDKAYSQLARYKNIFLDTAFVADTNVFKSALEMLGHQRLLYGTDQPLNLIRAKTIVDRQRGPRLATPFHYHWADPVEQKAYKELAKNATHMHWEILMALRKAIKSYGESEEIKNSIFYQNAVRVFNI